MNFKNIQTIFSFISLSLIVSSTPIGFEGESYGTEVVDDITFVKDEITDAFSKLANGISGMFDKAMKKGDDDDDICTTPECNSTASRILSNMDTEVDPCVDFYQFTCGNYLKTSVIPADKMQISAFSDVTDRNFDVIRKILEGDYKVYNNSTLEQQNLDKKIFGQLKSLYNSCIDENTIKSKGKTPLVDLLNQLEVYKNQDSYVEANGLTTLVAKLFSYKLPIFIDMVIESNINNPGTNIINISQTTLPLQSNELYKNEEVLAGYKEAIKTMFIDILNDEDQDSGNFFIDLFTGGNKRDFDKLSNSVVELEKKIASIQIPAERRNDLTLAKEYNINSLAKEFPYINWTLYFESIFGSANMKGTVKNDSVIMVLGPSYFNELSKIIKETDAETLAAYAEWNVIFKYADYISDEFNVPLKNIQSLITGTTEKPIRTKYCATIIDSSMGMAMGRYFAEEVFNEESREMAKDAVENIKESMKQRIPDVEWLDDPTSKAALEKLNAITDKIGYPDFVMDPVKLNEEYQGLEIVDKDFFTSVVNSSKFNVNKVLKYAYTPRDKSKWEMTPPTVNAYYNPLTNDINFPAGILRTPFFNSADPSYLNYGGIGTVIGHELTHAFDNTGKEFDLDGKYFNWWSNSTAEEFNKLTQCFVEQYGNYTVEDNKGNKINLNGNLTLGENIADNGGLARAYDAYKMSLNKKNKGNNQRLPGLTKYSNEQLFFISFGQIWCSKTRPETSAVLANIDPHSPGRYRVNGSLMNSKEFSKAFKCKANSPMNPEKKCSLW